jgi:hypothetical protein
MTCCGSCGSQEESLSMGWGREGFKIRQDDTFMVAAPSEFAGWKTGYGPGCECGGACGCSCGGGGTPAKPPNTPSGNGGTSTPSTTTKWDGTVVTAFPWRETTGVVSDDWAVRRESRRTATAEGEGTYMCMVQHDWAIPICPCWLHIALERGNSECIEASEDPSWAVNFFHVPAARCVRLWFENEKRGNQCCFDAAGKLITEGSGAGTPDSRNRNAPLSHFLNDVIPWFFQSLENYHKKFAPYHDKNCPANTGDPATPPSGPGGSGLPPLPPVPEDPEEVLDELRREARRICDNSIIPQIIEEFGPEKTPESVAAYEQRLDACFDEVFNKLLYGG